MCCKCWKPLEEAVEDKESFLMWEKMSHDKEMKKQMGKEIQRRFDV